MEQCRYQEGYRGKDGAVFALRCPNAVFVAPYCANHLVHATGSSCYEDSIRWDELKYRRVGWAKPVSWGLAGTEEELAAMAAGEKESE